MTVKRFLKRLLKNALWSGTWPEPHHTHRSPSPIKRMHIRKPVPPLFLHTVPGSHGPPVRYIQTHSQTRLMAHCTSMFVFSENLLVFDIECGLKCELCRSSLHVSTCVVNASSRLLTTVSSHKRWWICVAEKAIMRNEATKQWPLYTISMQQLNSVECY